MSTTGTPTPCWPTDLTRVCERLAERLDRSGAPHPVAAAVALAARGHRGLTIDHFADAMEIPSVTVCRAEAGHIPWEELPDVIGDLLEAMPNIDLLTLADLDAHYRGRGPATEW